MSFHHSSKNLTTTLSEDFTIQLLDTGGISIALQEALRLVQLKRDIFKSTKKRHLSKDIEDESGPGMA